ncbi:DUF4179 domain-containing protein [Paenibacillus faecis]|uniref:DUF4179 domain-containing protein n=1 Tax=Paenibacillus faecis TaxID=862114 RepID=A0A5D0CPD0_9BACL|nr:DUF4179 domain-containing protein [Paenibacillus faecis]TYA11114.1 DUF4179 domain-containing protein [Paenibacillus faecis]
MAEHQKKEWDLPQMLEDVRHAEERISDQKLETAIRQGLALGKARKRQVGLRLRVAFAAGVLTCGLAVLFGWQLWPPADPGSITVMGNSPASSIPERVLSMMSEAMKKAAENGLYQPINKATEKDGYRLTVDGVLADNRTMIIFVNAENLNNTGKIRSIQENFTNLNGGLLDEKYGSSTFGSNLSLQDQNKPSKSYYYTLQFKNTPSQMLFSEELELDFGSSSKKLSLKIPIQIDENKFSSLEKSVPVNQTVQIGEHQLKLTRAVLNPLSTTLEFKATSKLKKEGVADLQDAKLYLGETRKDQFQYFLVPRDSKSELLSSEARSLSAIRFDTLYYKDYSEVTLRATGITGNTAEKGKLIIDTEKQTLGPNSPMRLKEIKRTKDKTELHIQHPITKQNPESSISFKGNFTDQSGKEYSIQEGSFSKEDSSITISSQEYSQPLTFPYTIYTDHITQQPIEFRIKLK